MTALNAGIERLQGLITRDDQDLQQLHLWYSQCDQAAQAFSVAEKFGAIRAKEELNIENAVERQGVGLSRRSHLH
jgi:hypothetical protein